VFVIPVFKLKRNTATRIYARYEQLRFRERIRVKRRGASVILPGCFVHGCISHCHWGFNLTTSNLRRLPCHIIVLLCVVMFVENVVS